MNKSSLNIISSNTLAKSMADKASIIREAMSSALLRSSHPTENSGEHAITSLYFDNVPTIAWTMPIGGYQPAQKWLKDRIGRVLNQDDIQHYKNIIKILSETNRVMNDINTYANDIIG